MEEKSVVEILDGAIEKFNQFLDSAEVAIMPEEMHLINEALLDVGDAYKKVKKLSNMLNRGE